MLCQCEAAVPPLFSQHVAYCEGFATALTGYLGQCQSILRTLTRKL